MSRTMDYIVPRRMAGDHVVVFTHYCSGREIKTRIGLAQGEPRAKSGKKISFNSVFRGNGIENSG